MKRLIIIFAIVCSLLPTALAIYGEEFETLYMKKVGEADKATADGEWKAAEKALTEAISLEPDNPGNPLLLSNLGLIRFNMGLDSLAVATLTQAQHLAPASVTILTNRARILLYMGKMAEALDDFSNILTLDSLDVTARFNHCLLSLRSHDFKGASKDFEFLSTNFPELIETSIAGASYLSGTGQYQEAIPYYTKVIEERPDAEYIGGRAYCYLLLDRLQEASDDINAAIKLSPDDGELYLYRAALNKRRYRPKDAEADARMAIKLGVAEQRVAQFLAKSVINPK